MFEGPVTGDLPEVMDNGKITEGTHVTAGQLLALTPSPRHLAGRSCLRATGGRTPLARPVSRAAGSRRCTNGCPRNAP